MSAHDHELLGQFIREQSQDAFAELVHRHLNLVYSAALRQVRSPHLAEEISQTVFTHLARQAAKLRPDTILSAWLYQVTRHAAIDVIRSEARRQAREQIAFQMSDMNDPSAGWTQIEPLLDEAMESLDDADRAAILLRFFENKSLREVGEAIGASEDAAQKRVSRAVERLREFLSKRKVAVATGGLAALVSANAVQAAPVGLAAGLAASAVLSSTAIPAATAITLTKTIAMTTIQKILVTAAIAAVAAVGVYEATQASKLRAQVQQLEQQQGQQAALSNQVHQLQEERDQATNRLAALAKENAALKKSPTEVVKLRGDVGRLTQEKANLGSTSGLSKATANPESREMMRSQQKMAMAILYKSFTEQLKLGSEQSDKLNEVLADHVMDNVENVTKVLRDKLPPEKMNGLFAAQEAALQQQIGALLGPDSLAQYQDYTRNLQATLMSGEFRAKMTGTDAERDAKVTQLRQTLKQETQAALADASLPADYQVFPIHNFANIASEQQAEQSLKLLGDIYGRVEVRSGAFLSPDEVAKFREYGALLITAGRGSIRLNRNLMAPISN